MTPEMFAEWREGGPFDKPAWHKARLSEQGRALLNRWENAQPSRALLERAGQEIN